MKDSEARPQNLTAIGGPADGKVLTWDGRSAGVYYPYSTAGGFTFLRATYEVIRFTLPDLKEPVRLFVWTELSKPEAVQKILISFSTQRIRISEALRKFHDELEFSIDLVLKLSAQLGIGESSIVAAIGFVKKCEEILGDRWTIPVDIESEDSNDN